MREIKFRAWDKTHKKMIQETDTSYVTDDLDSRTVQTKLVVINNNLYRVTRADIDSFADDIGYLSSDFELLQYTGLKDKNGKEIYCGDFLQEYRVSDPDLVWEVGFEDGCFIAKGVGGIDYLKNFTKEFNVVGNIYESK